MVRTERWKAAQRYERSYWENASATVAVGAAPQLEWYRWRADRLVERLERLGMEHLTTGSAKVVEVGSGPVGCVTYFPGRERIAVDPLHPFFATDAVLSALRDPAVEYRPGIGEEIPCEDGTCDLVIIENCIDHVRDVHLVMRELVRILKPGGTLYLTVNGRTRPGYYVHRALSRLLLDPGHPHTFTPDRAVGLLERHGFTVLDRQVGSALQAFLDDLRGSGAKRRLKAALGVSEHLISLVARNRDGR
jgi:SAM-dependent methyltransferase